MSKESAKINCPTFQKQETLIEEITAKINDVEEVLKKVDFAEELQQEVNVLLSCPDYDQKNIDCSNCHFISNVRKKTAELVIKAKKLV